jgi:hypothetical protein
VIIANAIIWGLVMVVSAMRLKGTGCFGEIQGILGGGAAASLILLSGALGKWSKT